MAPLVKEAVRLFALLLASWCAGAGALAAPPVGEYQVKAAYLFNFGQFVEWPAQSFESAASPFVIGIIGDDPFGSTIDEAVRGESFNGRPLIVKRFREPEEITACNILFLGRSEASRIERIVKTLSGRNVLTVTDIAGAERHGAIIVLFTQNNRVRMRINLAAARASNLVISSNLLRPAEVVGNEGAVP